MSSHLHLVKSSRPCFASQTDKDRVLLALDAEVAAELARADFLRQARLERNARKRALATRTATTEGPVMRDLTNFTYGDAPVRVHLDDEGEPWFVLADLCKILDIKNSRDVASRVDEDAVGSTDVIDSLGRKQIATTVNEAGMYEVVFISRKEEARAFKRWVTHEVLPSIRKHGAYTAPSSSAPATLTGEALMAAALVEAQRVLANTQAQAVEATKRADVATSTIAAIEANAGLTITEFHKHYFSDMGAREFFQKLYDLELLIDQRGHRGRTVSGKVKNGHMHMHPSASGKKYFYLHSVVDAAGNRWERTRVRPGEAEVKLARYLTHRGLPLNAELVEHVERRELVLA